MSYIGTKPADQVLDSTLIADGTITSSKIVDGTITNTDINASAAISTSKISGLATVATTGSASDLGTGTLPAARLPTSGVTAGSYTATSLTVDATGRITSASNGSSGGVTSVATGNGLQGGTITSTGTLSVTCPTENSVGSYASLVFYFPNNTAGPSFGANYACGSGNRQLQIGAARQGEGETGSLEWTSGSVSGTWKWLGYHSPGTNYGGYIRLCATACRVS